jgi:hypothetical protein
MLGIDAHFNALVAARNLETNIRWQKVQIFFLINSALLGIILGANFPATLKIVACIFGLVITVVWFVIQREAQDAIDYWNKKISALEEKDQESGMRAFAFTSPREGFRLKYASTYYLILLLIGVFSIGWLSLLVYFIFV